MSKEPATPEAGGELPSRARGANAAPSQPGTRRSRHTSGQSERQAVHGALHDGAGTSAAMAAQGGHERHVSLVLPSQEGGQVVQYSGQRQERAYRGEEHPPAHDGAGFKPQPTAGRSRPSYVPPSQRRREQPFAAAARPAVEQPPVHGPHPHGGVPEERQARPLPPGGAPPIGGGLAIPDEAAPPRGKRIGNRKKETRTTTLWGRKPHPHQHPPGEAALPGVGILATPGGTAPPHGGGTTAPGGAPPPSPPRRIGVPTAKTIKRVSTLEFAPVLDGRPSPPRPHPQPEHEARPHPYPQPEHEARPRPYPQTEQYPETTPTVTPSGKEGRAAGRPSPLLLPERKKKKRPAAFCFTLCCILFWLLVVGIGVAVLVIYLLYHPQPPRLRVTAATLNAGYVDQLPPPLGGLALNSDLYVLAAIYNPNTKIDVVLRYMQLDLYFQGVMIGTQAVLPPIHEEPGDRALRAVELVVSEVRMKPEDAELWHNATTKGGLVEMELAGRFHVQLNFGRWLPFRYWVYPSCSLWLDPPPGGALRRARCRQ